MPYEREFEATARLAFGMWNRDSASPSYGSFDRAWWGWKFKDFPDATLQYAARLAVPYALKAGEGSPIGEWLEAWVRFIGTIQHRDGSLDQAYPHERTPGVVFDVLSTFTFVYEGPHLSAESRARLGRIIERAAGFAIRTDEHHGEIANHIAEYAYELAEYARFSGDPVATAAAGRYLARLLSLFDREEGWFREYEGPDPGYQTRTLRYLVKLARLPGYEGLWDVAERAGDFLADFIMPDGSVHPMLGTRSTGILYPSGIEALAARDPGRFGALAGRVRAAWEQGLVPLPSTIDFANAIRLADDAREAVPLMASLPEAPAAGPSGTRSLPRAGLAAWRTESRQVFLASSLGGVVVAYDRHPGGWRLAFEDSGYLLRARGASWLTRMAGAGTLVSIDEKGATVRSRFARVLHDELTPPRFLLLRILNLTVLRSQWIGDLFRKLVVERLMAGRSWLPITLTRGLRFEGDRLRLDDIVEGENHIAGRMWRCRRLTGAHMASARYFHSSELQSLGGWSVRVEWDGRRYRDSRTR
jgi:hypothetical protein